MDATASGAQWQSQGEMNLVSGMRRADGRRYQLCRRNWPDRYEVRRELWRDGRGRRNRVVLTPPGWRQVLRRCVRLNRACDASSIRKATVATVHGSPGRSRISRKPLRGESRSDPVALWSTRALLVHDRGCDRRPAFPAPSLIESGRNQCKPRAHRAAGSRTCIQDSINVIASAAKQSIFLSCRGYGLLRLRSQ